MHMHVTTVFEKNIDVGHVGQATFWNYILLHALVGHVPSRAPNIIMFH